VPADPGPRAGLEITSPANPRVKEIVALRRRRSRDTGAVTLVEGYEELGLALDAGVRPYALYHCPGLTAGDPGNLLARAGAQGAEVIRVSRAVFEKIAYRESPDGWLAVVPTVATDLGRLRLAGDPLILVCEGVEKPGNLGAILRTADAAGVAAVIAADPVTDWGNPNLVRASKGTLFSVPVAAAPSADVLRWLAERGAAVVAATPNATTLPTDVDFTAATAIAVGSEKHGLSAPWLAGAHATVRIPMFGRADSLNVATSAAILAYEAVRQRLLVSGTDGPGPGGVTC
jgi:TrmH family RNA methyltransferase